MLSFKSEYTAYRFFSLVQRFDEVLKELPFDEYGELQSKNRPLFSQHPALVQMRRQIESFPCASGLSFEGDEECEADAS